MKIIIYKKTGCPWAAAVIAYLVTEGYSFEIRDINTDPQFKREIKERSGQSKSPTLDIDGTILADASVEDVDNYLEKNK
jgi:monothiol glutaredoxin